MSVDDFRPGGDKELYHRGIGFLKRAQDLRGLSPSAVDRIERRLQQPWSPRRHWLARRPLLVAVSVLCVALLAGSIAVARVGLRGLPLVGALFTPKHANPETVAATRRQHRAVSKSSPATSPPVTAPIPIFNEQASVQPGALIAPVLPSVPAPAQGGGSRAVGSPASAEATRSQPSVPAPQAVAPARASKGASRDSSTSPHTPGKRRLALAAPGVLPRESIPDGPAVTEILPRSENPVVAESRSFSAAIEQWHRNRDPVAALVALDEHDRGFPNGHLQIESRLLRAEILLAQGREREGLALLDRMNLAGSPRARELLTVRGELRIKVGRCPDGRADLAEVLSKGVSDSLGKRAAEALAHCP